MTRPRILLVEDDTWLAQQQARLMTAAGYDVTVAGHALDALERIDRQVPDALVLDVLLTGSNAFALLNELRSYDDTGDLPIILCTTLAADMKIDDMEPYGVRRIIDKTTMHPDDIVTALRSVL